MYCFCHRLGKCTTYIVSRRAATESDTIRTGILSPPELGQVADQQSGSKSDHQSRPKRIVHKPVRFRDLLACIQSKSNYSKTHARTRIISKLPGKEI
ncbi:hypothetical protein L1987_61516 [Smallanthus sonchifolius]|uniref:Uncharacterized protein n=1 Tax=Smallanthus sonchifolius TaxID=185202 RepID=A0ACB9C7U7_9ASTR|nr:hypothetical protein L1987_61516 [Smallanthus sonchifolius]